MQATLLLSRDIDRRVLQGCCNVLHAIGVCAGRGGADRGGGNGHGDAREGPANASLLALVAEGVGFEPTLLEQRGVPLVWRRSIAEALDVIELLDARVGPIDAELGPLARADTRVALLDTIPGVGALLGLTIASEIGDVARFGSPRKLVGYAGMAPKVSQSGERSRTGALSKAGSRTLRRAAVARKILIATWHVLSRQQPFKPAAPRRPHPASASSRCFLAA
jgi:transposase